MTPALTEPVFTADFNQEARIQAMVSRLVARGTDLDTLCIITVDKNNNDEIELVGDLHVIQQLLGAAMQQIIFELAEPTSPVQ